MVALCASHKSSGLPRRWAAGVCDNAGTGASMLPSSHCTVAALVHNGCSNRVTSPIAITCSLAPFFKRGTVASQETIGVGSDVGGQGVGEPTGPPSVLGRGCWGDDVPAKKSPSRDGYMPTDGPPRPIVSATWDFDYLNSVRSGFPRLMVFGCCFLPWWSIAELPNILLLYYYTESSRSSLSPCGSRTWFSHAWCKSGTPTSLADISASRIWAVPTSHLQHAREHNDIKDSNISRP